MDTKRFHTPEYKRQMRAVRTYKRKAQPLPESSFRKFLFKIGMGSLLRQAAFIIVVGLAAYLAYFAKFLQVQKIIISGADQSEQADISGIFGRYLNSYYGIFPRKNVIFFGTSSFKQYLLQNDPNISGVNSVKISSLSSISASVNQRVPAFNLQAQNGIFMLYSDGTASSAVQGQNTAYPLVSDVSGDQITPGEKVLDQQNYAFLSYVNSNFQSISGSAVDHYELPGISSKDLVVYSKLGYKVYFDATQDPKEYLNRMLGVLSQIPSDQQAKLFYIDLRFDPNAYVCYKGDKCSLPPVPPPAANSTGGGNQQGSSSAPSALPQALPNGQ